MADEAERRDVLALHLLETIRRIAVEDRLVARREVELARSYRAYSSGVRAS
jgi:hypothetical protein